MQGSVSESNEEDPRFLSQGLDEDMEGMEERRRDMFGESRIGSPLPEKSGFIQLSQHSLVMVIYYFQSEVAPIINFFFSLHLTKLPR